MSVFITIDNMFYSLSGTEIIQTVIYYHTIV